MEDNVQSALASYEAWARDTLALAPVDLTQRFYSTEGSSYNGELVMTDFL